MNHVERVVLVCGYAVERTKSDYGIDLTIDTTDRRGEIEPGHIDVQVKATDALPLTTDGREVLQRIAVADLKAWLFEVAPVVLVVYDAKADVAYWLDVQEYARGLDPVETMARRTITLRIPRANVWTPDAVRRLREVKNRFASGVKRSYPDDN